MKPVNKIKIKFLQFNKNNYLQLEREECNVIFFD